MKSIFCLFLEIIFFLRLNTISFFLYIYIGKPYAMAPNILIHRFIGKGTYEK